MSTSYSLASFNTGFTKNNEIYNFNRITDPKILSMEEKNILDLSRGTL